MVGTPRGDVRTPRRSVPTYFAAASALLSRALRRLAAFRWMIPRFAALSIAAMAARICSAPGFSEERTCFWIVRSRVTELRLRSDRFKVWRARLEADLVLAIANQNLVKADACEHEALHAFAQYKLRFLPLSSKRSSHSHLLDAECA